MHSQVGFINHIHCNLWFVSCTDNYTKEKNHDITHFNATLAETRNLDNLYDAKINNERKAPLRIEIGQKEYNVN